MKCLVRILPLLLTIAACGRTEKSQPPLNSTVTHGPVDPDPKDKRDRITPTPDPSSPSGIYIPKDLDDTFRELDRMLTAEFREEFKSTNETDTIKYHFGLGLWMRNNWRLWSGSRLAQSLQMLGVQHPDDMSGVIITSYWRHLNGKDIALDAQIRRSKQYWASATEPADRRCPSDKTKMSVDSQLVDHAPDGQITLRHVARCPNGHIWVFSRGRGWEKPSQADLKRINGEPEGSIKNRNP